MQFKKVEKKWRDTWKKEGTYRTKDVIKGKKNFYHMVMFPYPSGDLHIGHWYNFAPADVFARFKRMKGFNVLSPIGFDAFGLPAENAAIKRGIHPKTWTYKNIKTMTAQLENMGTMYDWERSVITADPEYYQWTQWMFLQLFHAGLAYRTKAKANWCPKDRTVLANEQVIDGKCDRCGTEVVQRDIDQWLLKITDYAERLLGDLENLDWPEKTKTMQRNWIGKSEGAVVRFAIAGIEDSAIEVFTTRVDTIFGCTYVVVAPEHSLIGSLHKQIENYKEVSAYVAKARKKAERERLIEEKKKTGVEIKGIKAINPLTGESVPVFVADYVLGGYGTGAVMAVPAHDERDLAFAKQFGLPIKTSIVAPGVGPSNECVTDDGVLVDSESFTGMDSATARKEMTKWLTQQQAGFGTVNYKLRDWLISRQRYWGSPIPLVFCEHCKARIDAGNYKKGEFTKGELTNPGWVGVKEQSLPVVLPSVKNYLPTEEGKSPLAHSKSFVHAACPQCGEKGTRETDTMDTFMCSSWYYLRYPDPHNAKRFADPKKLEAWLPVDMYVGGPEHATMHLLYVRFFTKVLHDLKHVKFNEPFMRLFHQGTILGPDGQKMSKSKGNVIDPDDLVDKFGADAVRMYLCFMGPYDQGGPWQPGGMVGIARFLQRIEALYGAYAKQARSAKKPAKNAAVKKALHQAIKKVTEDIGEFRFNTAMSALMILLNTLEDQRESLDTETLEQFLLLLAPFAPYFSEELYRGILHKKQSVHAAVWPKYNARLAAENDFDLVIQINGKTRDTIRVSKGISQERARELALASVKVRNAAPGMQIKKVIFVPDRLINLVIGS